MQNLKFTFTYDKNSFAKVAKRTFTHYPIRKYINFALGIALILIAYFFIDFTTFDLMSWVSFIGLLVLFVLVYKFYQTWRYRRMYSLNPKLKEPINCTINKDGIHFKATTYTMFNPWNEISRFIEDNEAFTLVNPKTLPIVILKEHLNNTDEKLLLKWINTHITK